jgi:hypothetical protein
MSLYELDMKNFVSFPSDGARKGYSLRGWKTCLKVSIPLFKKIYFNFWGFFMLLDLYYIPYTDPTRIS